MENDFDSKLFVNEVTSYKPIASLQQWAFKATVRTNVSRCEETTSKSQAKFVAQHYPE